MWALCLRPVKLNQSLTLVFGENGDEHLVIHFDDGCACLYLLHSINSFLSLLHPVCEGCTLLHYISSRRSRNIKKKKRRRTLITPLRVILHFKRGKTWYQGGGCNRSVNNGGMLMILKAANHVWAVGPCFVTRGKSKSSYAASRLRSCINSSVYQ